ncbi:TPA: hypothetical protein ACH3X1_011425 [Trebouxia sp. C0004]
MAEMASLQPERSYVGDLMCIVAGSHPHQKAVLRNKYAAVRCMCRRISLLATCMSITVTPSMYKTTRIECDRFGSIFTYISAHSTYFTLHVCIGTPVLQTLIAKLYPIAVQPLLNACLVTWCIRLRDQDTAIYRA